MVTKFNTNTPASSGGSSKTIMIVAGLAIAGFLAWKYILKPAQDKKAKEVKSNADSED